jgi:phosphopantothenoylcysteine decarboxylase/phosphopantothenate--cysteine ligase
VDVDYPSAAEVLYVVSTEEMLRACQEAFPRCHGLIAAAAPCDYRPEQVARHKLRKIGQPLRMELIETPDIVATLAKSKGPRWMVAFALETEDKRMRALQKLERKKCDLIVLNGPGSIHGPNTDAEIIDPAGHVLAALSGRKEDVARQIFRVLDTHLILRTQQTRRV